MAIIKLDGSKPAAELRGPPSPLTPTPSSTCCLWFAGLLMWGFVIYTMASPLISKWGGSAVVDEKLMALADSINEKKSSLSKQMEVLQEMLSQQKEALMEKTGDISLPGVVGKGHHEEELAKLATEHKEEMAKLQEDHDKLKEHHEEEISTLEESIAQSKAELEKLRDALGGLKIDPEKFCAECPFDHSGLRTTCGARRDFLMGRHGSTQEDAVEAVAKWDPNCLKKDRRRRRAY